MKKFLTSKKKRPSANQMEMLITSRHPKSPVSESFRSIRTNIDFSSFDKEINTLLITSSSPAEGKSTVTANLGVTMAATGKKTLIIDADLRNPTQHKCFGISNNIGLTNVLVNESILFEDALVCTNVDNLFLLTTGPLPPNPAELLNSKKMRDFFAFLTQHFDMILVDAPPVMAVTDASILASYLDGVILVVASGQAKIEQIRSAKEQLSKVQANLLGAVLNKAPKNGSYYYHYYYGTSN
jgi:capsular exopolysaccharide synthesis family protein